MRRTRPHVGQVAVLVATALASTAASASAADTLLDWQLVGVGADQRSLVIASGDPDQECKTNAAVAEIVSSTSRAVKLQLRQPEGNQVPCTQPAAYIPSKPYVVPLPWAIKGQAIKGSERTTAPIDLQTWGVWGAPARASSSLGPWRAPSTVGLKAADAIEILRSIGVSRARIELKGPKSGWVSKQTPKSRKTFEPASAQVVLTTKRPQAGA